MNARFLDDPMIWFRWVRGLAAGVGLLVLFSALGYGQRLGRTASGSEPRRVAAAVVFPKPAAPTALEWAVFQAASPPAEPVTPAALQRYRLAGTFVELDTAQDRSKPPLRKAILDDLEHGVQCLVGEGEWLGTMRLERVWMDRVLLSVGEESFELRLSHRDLAAAESSSGSASTTGAGVEELEALERSRFGRRIEKNRWELSRDELMNYYSEMLDAPERVARLYETFEPVYQEDGRIGGYRIALKGEEAFLKAMGLQENDVVRAVNSLNMTSQSRAEFFIREFVQGRLDTVVLEIERGGAPQKLIYLIR